uniref:Rad21_Rec8 domain-containing protein n=1 Tax=Schistocephalus solidus TaxID=70667 RepID=A0A183SSM9_SCHSO
LRAEDIQGAEMGIFGGNDPNRIVEFADAEEYTTPVNLPISRSTPAGNLASSVAEPYLNSGSMARRSRRSAGGAGGLIGRRCSGTGVGTATGFNLMSPFSIQLPQLDGIQRSQKVLDMRLQNLQFDDDDDDDDGGGGGGGGGGSVAMLNDNMEQWVRAQLSGPNKRTVLLEERRTGSSKVRDRASRSRKLVNRHEKENNLNPYAPQKDDAGTFTCRGLDLSDIILALELPHSLLLPTYARCQDRVKTTGDGIKRGRMARPEPPLGVPPPHALQRIRIYHFSVSSVVPSERSSGSIAFRKPLDFLSLPDHPDVLHLPASQEGCFSGISPKVHVGFSLEPSSGLQSEPHLGGDEAVIRPTISIADHLGYQHILSILPPDMHIIQQLPAPQPRVHPRDLLPRQKAEEGVGQQRKEFRTRAQKAAVIVTATETVRTQHTSPRGTVYPNAGGNFTKDN